MVTTNGKQTVKNGNGKQSSKSKSKKPKIKRHKFSGKLAKPTAKSGDRKTSVDQLGRRLGGAAHHLCEALAAAAAPLDGETLAAEVEKRCKRSGVAPRKSGSYSNQLNALKIEELATDADGGWQLTARGKAIWRAGKANSRTELRKGRTLSELRKTYNDGKTLAKLKTIVAE